jgi:group I intron endonuclease
MNIERGIYKITNLTTGVVYIGSTTKFKRRFNEHIKALSNQKHHNYKLQNLWDKYGEKDFAFEVIEYIEDVDMLPQKEQYYVDEYRKLNKCINISEPEEEFIRRKSTKILNKVKLKYKLVYYVRLLEKLVLEKKDVITSNLDEYQFYDKQTMDEYFIKGIMGEEEQLLQDDRIHKVLHRLYNKCGLATVSGIKYRKELKKLGIDCEVRGDILVSLETNRKLYELRFKKKVI